ncbi:MAG: glucuronate isomerase [Akkermansiaceae bacterium]|nr:glucuronate isomerase [Akkermansiaceae bacterium]
MTEDFITGTRSDWEKFQTFCTAMPRLVLNPVHQWAHLELQRVFGIDTVLSPATAKMVWEETQRQFRERGDLGVRDILRAFHYEVVCSTDDPADSLEAHAAFAALPATGLAVYPTFRPDLAMALDQPEVKFLPWLKLIGDGLREIDCLCSRFGGGLAVSSRFFPRSGCASLGSWNGALPAIFCHRRGSGNSLRPSTTR